MFKVETTGLNFGEALQAMKDGHTVSREGWNGKGMFLLYVPPYDVPKNDVWGRSQIDQLFLNRRGLDHLPIQGHIDLWTADNKLCVGWLASQMDMQANDWCIVTVV
jgi:hypothetical protein